MQFKFDPTTKKSNDRLKQVQAMGHSANMKMTHDSTTTTTITAVNGIGGDATTDDNNNVNLPGTEDVDRMLCLLDVVGFQAKANKCQAFFIGMVTANIHPRPHASR